MSRRLSGHNRQDKNDNTFRRTSVCHLGRKYEEKLRHQNDHSRSKACLHKLIWCTSSLDCSKPDKGNEQSDKSV